MEGATPVPSRTSSSFRHETYGRWTRKNGSQNYGNNFFSFFFINWNFPRIFLILKKNLKKFVIRTKCWNSLEIWRPKNPIQLIWALTCRLPCPTSFAHFSCPSVSVTTIRNSSDSPASLTTDSNCLPSPQPPVSFHCSNYCQDSITPSTKSNR